MHLSRRLTDRSEAVLLHLLANPTAEFYGRGVVEATGVNAGTVSRTLIRLLEAGVLVDRLEDPNTPGGRQRRRYFRFALGGPLHARHLLPTPTARPNAGTFPAR